MARFRIILNTSPHKGFSYKTLRYGGISVSGGELERTQRTVRIEAGDGVEGEPELRNHPDWNRDWTVTVQLKGDRTVVSFPANDIARRSVYTEEGRVLANQTTITIPDPDERGDSRVQRWLR
jgi:hypothetical protein